MRPTGSSDCCWSLTVPPAPDPMSSRQASASASASAPVSRLRVTGAGAVDGAAVRAWLSRTPAAAVPVITLDHAADARAGAVRAASAWVALAWYEARGLAPPRMLPLARQARRSRTTAPRWVRGCIGRATGAGLPRSRRCRARRDVVPGWWRGADAGQSVVLAQAPPSRAPTPAWMRASDPVGPNAMRRSG